MSSLNLISGGGLAAMLGGVVWIIYTLLGLAGGDLEESNPLDILIIIAWLLQVVGLVGFHTLQNRYYGRIGPLGRKRDTWRASNRRRGVGHNGRVDFVWCSYFASQGIAAVVRHSDHRSPTRHDTLGGLRGHVLWTRLASTGLHALVTQGSTV